MNLTTIAVTGAILLVVYLFARWIIKAQRRYGWGAAWLVIIIEACAVGGLIYLLTKYVPGMGDTWVGQQLILAVVGVGLAIVLGGGMVIALGRR